jgi:hypothetical protein
MQPQRPLADIVGRDQFVSGYDIDFEDEGAQAEAAEAEAESTEGETERADQRAGDDRGYREGRPRDEWRGDDRFDRGQNDRGGDRDRQFRGPRDDRFREDRFRDNRGGRDERPRFERQDRPDRPERERERDRPDRERDRDRSERGEARPPSPYRAESQEHRPPVSEAEAAPVLRADDGDVSHAPAFLQARAQDSRDEPAGETRRLRRRRAPRDFADGEAPPAGPETEES